MKKPLDILKRVGGTVMLPVIMFVIMKILCSANGKLYLANWKMWMVIIPNVAVTVACAMGIGLQFKNGRFDFSGGAIMLLSAITAGSIARDSGIMVINSTEKFEAVVNNSPMGATNDADRLGKALASWDDMKNYFASVNPDATWQALTEYCQSFTVEGYMK